MLRLQLGDYQNYNNYYMRQLNSFYGDDSGTLSNIPCIDIQ